MKLTFARLAQELSGLEVELLGDDGLRYDDWTMTRPDRTSTSPAATPATATCAPRGTRSRAAPPRSCATSSPSASSGCRPSRGSTRTSPGRTCPDERPRDRTRDASPASLLAARRRRRGRPARDRAPGARTGLPARAGRRAARTATPRSAPSVWTTLTRRPRPGRPAGARAARRCRRLGARGGRGAGGARPGRRARAVPHQRGVAATAPGLPRGPPPTGCSPGWPPATPWRRCWCRPPLRSPTGEPSRRTPDGALSGTRPQRRRRRRRRARRRAAGPGRDGHAGVALHAVEVPTSGVDVTPVTSLDMTRPLADVDARPAPPRGSWPRTPPTPLRRGACSPAPGCSPPSRSASPTWCLEATVAHLRERRQFGRVVGGFQALKHRLADLYAEVGSATAAARYAAAALAAGDPDAAGRRGRGAVVLRRRRRARRRGGRAAARRARHDLGAPGPPAPQARQGRPAAAGHAGGAPRDGWPPWSTCPAPDPERNAAPMDLTLSDEQQSFRDLARDFLDKEAVPHRVQWDRDEAVDLAIVPKMAEIGFFGLTIPEEYGGLGGDYVTYAIAMEELGRADSALRGIVSVSSGLVGKSILFFGSEEQKQEWLPQLADGDQAGLLRPHRARHRLRRRQPDLAGDQGRRRLRAERPEALHHQRHLGRRRARLRPHQRRGPARRHGVPGADRHPRLRGPRDQGQARAARPGHRRAVPLRRAGARVRACSARSARASRSR